MNPASLIPVAEPLPIPWGWFDILLVLTFAVHILFMNALLGSAAIGLLRAMKGDAGLARDVGDKAPPLLALTINFGVAPLLFLQVLYGHFDYVSSVLMGGWWLAVIPVLMVAYYGYYAAKFGWESMGAGKRNLLLAVALSCLLYTGFMLTNNMTLMLLPEAWTEYFTASGGFLNLSDPTLLPRYLHFMVGALAVGGLFIALLGRSKERDDYVATGMTWFTRATMVNLLVGFWFLLSLPRPILLLFMGGSQPATMVLLASLIGAGMAIVAGLRKDPVKSALWAVLTVLFMSLTRNWLRAFYLAPWFTAESTPVTSQYSSFYLFLGFLVGGLGLMGYMMKLYLRSRERRA
ncbi:hypothetical protein [Pseudodesulfovibrio sp.]|uniref:hypothetical protein n=1 Tax=Pseudodesulfovibrio sp. TaxID=2035812 RepID=UPI00263110F0|nr:hypothetical protein [Pseudodesulfovibrio sp.]MDD3312707.1 hypothetical protein [Pseudodesulfovibrio sp.]